MIDIKGKKLLIFVLICIIIFCIFNYIFYVFGNNKNRNQELIENKFKNYEANIEVIIISNKTQNMYKMFQENSEGVSYLEIKYPENIKGLSYELNGNLLKIINAKLNLEKIYENYSSIMKNSLFLNTFFEDYNLNGNNYETENEIVYNASIENSSNTYIKYKELHINKKTNMPTELIIKDDNQKTIISIKYNDIKIK